MDSPALFIAAGLGLLLILALVFRGVVRLRESRRGNLLRLREFAPDEQKLLRVMARRAGVADPGDLLHSNDDFEEAVEASLEFLAGDENSGPVLDRIRRKRGWIRPEHGLVESRVLCVNQEIKLNGTGDRAGIFSRAVIAHVDSSKLVLRVHDDRPSLPWRQGDQIHLQFWRPNDAEYSFDSLVLDCRSQVLKLLIVALPTQIERHQKRSFVRAPHKIKFRYQVVPQGHISDPEHGAELDDRAELHDGFTENIGVAGFLMVTGEPLLVGDYISVPYFPPVGEEQLLGRIVSTLGRSVKGHQYGIHLVGISALATEALTKKVLDAPPRAPRLDIGETHPVAQA